MDLNATRRAHNDGMLRVGHNTLCFSQNIHIVVSCDRIADASVVATVSRVGHDCRVTIVDYTVLEMLSLRANCGWRHLRSSGSPGECR